MYRVLFDVRFRGPFIATQLGIAAVILLVAAAVVMRPRWSRSTRVRLAVPLSPAGFFVAVPPLATLADWRRLETVQATGSAFVIEGPVSTFEPGSWADHRPESFTVKGVRFEYSVGIITAAFNETADRGGPVREGIWLRVTYLRGEPLGNGILRLEERDSSP